MTFTVLVMNGHQNGLRSNRNLVQNSTDGGFVIVVHKQSCYVGGSWRCGHWCKSTLCLYGRQVGHVPPWVPGNGWPFSHNLNFLSMLQPCLGWGPHLWSSACSRLALQVVKFPKAKHWNRSSPELATQGWFNFWSIDICGKTWLSLDFTLCGQSFMALAWITHSEWTFWILHLQNVNCWKSKGIGISWWVWRFGSEKRSPLVGLLNLSAPLQAFRLWKNLDRVGWLEMVGFWLWRGWWFDQWGWRVISRWMEPQIWDILLFSSLVILQATWKQNIGPKSLKRLSTKRCRFSINTNQFEILSRVSPNHIKAAARKDLFFFNCFAKPPKW